MTEYQKTNHVLPTEVKDAFASLADLETRNTYSLALREQEWTLQSIAEATGVTRERVRQVTNALKLSKGEATEWAKAQGLPLPTPPVKPVRVKREFIEPDPQKLARMLELQPLAQQVRANSPQYREEAEEYTRLIAESHLEDGVTLYRLALRLGLTHGALRFRLARYGYKLPTSGRSKVYTRIDPQNRVAAKHH
ncbi:helix-turn-helix DNA binding domain protein [Microbacterium phage Pumpernickel]|uniref:Helix-turn-helix DNA binding domain protein n=1 Tax=Microbacterium phage Pumpernickel TaxID=2885983 RepID=A0AAE8Y7H9_9CAUD|nr:helix-turn-helix DNA binding domain protein [Microbacterium phage Pumpernickel]YP_010755340.1 helix-turn-helix DNA binding domain protein [Microbacterium phage Pumpernickel]UDL15840.1 helix-turn-helix DNA binding domain protein [Microbacterium phage Pumpernickel]UDL16100.1 helix-turn-helix DNA binding domain protein [Microbacterium phage Pumpernickel]